MHKCLRDNRKKLSERCRQEELLLEEKEAESVELNMGLLKACKAERQLFCKDVQPGQARVFRCLAENMNDADFSNTCKYQIIYKLQRRCVFCGLLGCRGAACTGHGPLLPTQGLLGAPVLDARSTISMESFNPDLASSSPMRPFSRCAGRRTGSWTLPCARPAGATCRTTALRPMPRTLRRAWCTSASSPAATT